jgi:beta-carotene 3-hydroxylase
MPATTGRAPGCSSWNDLYAVIFALPSILLLLGGVQLGWWPGCTWIGAGIAAYGAIYFGFHDVIVHRRVPTATCRARPI